MRAKHAKHANSQAPAHQLTDANERASTQASKPARAHPPTYSFPCYLTIYLLTHLDSLRGSSVEIGTLQRRLAWPQHKDDTHKSRSVDNLPTCTPAIPYG